MDNKQLNNEEILRDVKELLLSKIKHKSGNIREHSPIRDKINNLDLQIVKKILKIDGSHIEHIQNQTPELCLIAVKKNPLITKYIKHLEDPTPCLSTIKYGCYALPFVKNQTEEVCLEAVKQDGFMIRYVDNQTYDICVAAIDQDYLQLEFNCLVQGGYHSDRIEGPIKYIKNQNLDLCILAFDRFMFKLIGLNKHSKDEDIKDADFNYEFRYEIIYFYKNYLSQHLSKNYKLNKNSYTLEPKNSNKNTYMDLVKLSGYFICFITDKNNDLCMAAVQQTPMAIYLMPKQTHELCLAAVTKDGLALQFIKEPTPEIYLAAVTQNGLALRFIRKLTHELCLAAVTQNGDALRYVHYYKTQEICLIAFTNNAHSLEYIDIDINVALPIQHMADRYDNISYQFIKNLLKYRIDKPQIIKNYLKSTEYTPEIIELLQEYDYPFSQKQIIQTIQDKVEVPHIHQYGYDINDSILIYYCWIYNFYPKSYNIDTDKIQKISWNSVLNS